MKTKQQKLQEKIDDLQNELNSMYLKKYENDLIVGKW